MTIPTGTVTFLFTDIEGSTRLWEAHPDAMSAALARHDSVLREAIERNGGYVFKTVGDAFCAAFHTAIDGLNAAIEAQLGLAGMECGEIGLLRVRMGLHTGSAEERDNDYFGPALNRTARLQSAAHGQQTLLSLVTTELVRSLLPPDATLNDLGPHRLKDLAAPEHVWQLLQPALPQEFPPLNTLDRLPTNLPQQLTSFIGREKEMAVVKALLEKSRLVTLTGSGGCGKTRLAVQASADMLEQYADGVWLVELAPISDPSLVPQSVAQAMSIREVPGEPITKTLLSALRDKRTMLILDNCEHLLEASAHLADAILHGCPKVMVLASSREALGIAGELSYRVPSLCVPDPKKHNTPDSLAHFESIRLFVERAQFHQQQFTVTKQNGPSLASICRRLDGIPLAIELAAARVRSLSVEDIENRLNQRFRLLTGGSRTALPRQQTLRSLIDWSYDLLKETEKALLNRVSVFAGGWTLEAAEAVCVNETAFSREWAPERTSLAESRSPTEDCLVPDEVMDLLTALCDKSLVVADTSVGTVRYRLLETVRQYARDRLFESGDGEHWRDRHVSYFLALAEEAKPQLQGPDQNTWFDRLETEHDNIRAALDWSLRERGAIECPEPHLLAPTPIRLATAIWRFWEVRGHMSEGREQLSRALGEPGVGAAARAKALEGAGNLARCQGDYAAARAILEEGLAIWRELGDRRGIASSLNNLGLVAHNQGDFPAGRTFREESLAIFRELGDRPGIANVLNGAGILARLQGDFAAARALYAESLAIQQELGDRRGIALSLNNLGNVAYAQGDYPTARAFQEESVAIHRELGDRQGIALLVANLGTVAHAQGDYPTARALYEEGMAIARGLGDRRRIAMSLKNLGNLAYDQGDYPTARAFQVESMSIFRELGDRSCIAYNLEGLASLTAVMGTPLNASRLWGAAERLREEIGTPLPPNERSEREQHVTAARAALGDDAGFDGAWAEGRGLTMEEAVELAPTCFL